MTKYLSLISSFLLVVIYALFRRRGTRIAELETKAETIQTKTELNQLEKESQDARNNSQKTYDTYVSYVNNNRELAEKLGIGPDAKRNKTSD